LKCEKASKISGGGKKGANGASQNTEEKEKLEAHGTLGKVAESHLNTTPDGWERVWTFQIYAKQEAKVSKHYKTRDGQEKMENYRWGRTEK